MAKQQDLCHRLEVVGIDVEGAGCDRVHGREVTGKVRHEALQLSKRERTLGAI